MKELSLNRIKYLSKLNKKKYRQSEEYALVEGLRAVDHIIEHGIEIDYIISTQKSSPYQNIDFYNTDQKSMQRISDTKNPQSIAALVKIPKPKLFNRKRLVFLDNVKDPGNLGAMFRISQAAGIDGIILSSQSCDPFNPKAVRASMGCVFTLPYSVDGKDFLFENDFYIIATKLKNGINIFKLEKKPDEFVLCIGSEAFGLDEKIIEKSDLRIYIPLENNVESLNASVAAGICIYNLIY